MSGQHSAPFSRGGMLALVLLGSLAFLVLLWSIGRGMDDAAPNPAQAHVSGKGLVGYAAFATYLEKRGYAVSRVQSPAALKGAGLLVLTPPAFDGKSIETVVEEHRHRGPTLVIAPKWIALPGEKDPKGKPREGWVRLAGARPPSWEGFHDEITVDVSPMRSGGQPGYWQGAGLKGAVPVSEQVLSGSGETLVPLVVGAADGRVLAAYLDDGGDYPALRDIAAGYAPVPDEDEADYELYPVVLVFEPDLLNNYGFADEVNARLAERLVRAMVDGGDRKVAFDLTLNGYARSQNLLSMAFVPPFLAATLCLIFAALVTGWRAFHRFGPPLVAGRAIAFGKRALVANAAALVRRTGRLHLIGAPYADAARERLARALALPVRLDTAAVEAAIDRALAARAPGATPFSAAAATLRAARRPHDLLRAARTLHSLERILTK